MWFQSCTVHVKNHGFCQTYKPLDYAPLETACTKLNGRHSNGIMIAAFNVFSAEASMVQGQKSAVIGRPAPP